MDNIISYFNGEKLQCSVGAIISVSFIAFSIFLLFQQKLFLKGIAWTVIPLSALLLIICIGVIYRTSSDIERVTNYYNNNREKIEVDEIPRMEKVIKSFNILMKVELVIFFLGVVLAIFFWKNELIRGVAVGLIVMGVSLYTFDYIAESRGEKYLMFLKSL